MKHYKLCANVFTQRFSPNSSVYAQKHSSGCLVFGIANLPPALRYACTPNTCIHSSFSHRFRVENLLVAAMTPGPNEPTSEQLQNYMRLLVDDLLALYLEGVRIPTPSCPDGTCLLSGQVLYWSNVLNHITGRLVEVYVIVCIADHPAMCKLCAMADHKHNNDPCTRCEVTQSELFDNRVLRSGETVFYLYIHNL